MKSTFGEGEGAWQLPRLLDKWREAGHQRVFRPTQVLEDVLALFGHKLDRKAASCEKKFFTDKEIFAVESEKERA